MIKDNRNAANIQYFAYLSFTCCDYRDQFNQDKNTYNCYDNNDNSRKLWKIKYYVCGKKRYRYINHSDNQKRKTEELRRRKQEFCRDKRKYNAFLAYYERDSDDEMDNDNKKQFIQTRITKSAHNM